MNELHIPDRAIDRAREAFTRAPAGVSAVRLAVEAAATLIVAAELRRLTGDHAEHFEMDSGHTRIVVSATLLNERADELDPDGAA